MNVKPIGPRRIYRHLDLLRAMRDQRTALGMTLEDVSERAGVCDRYYNKVEMGLVSEAVRQMKAQIRGRPAARWGTTVKRPFRMETGAAWALEARGMAVVVLPLAQAKGYRRIDVETARQLGRELVAAGEEAGVLIVCPSVEWILECMGLTLVLMDYEEALWTVEPDPVITMERRRLAA